MRFPTLRDKILNKLDYKSLNNFKKISRIIYKFIEDGKILQVRICQKDIYECPKIWKMDLSKATADIVNDLAENHLQVSLNKTVVEKWPRFWDLVLNKNEVEVIRELKNAIQQREVIQTRLKNFQSLAQANGLRL